MKDSFKNHINKSPEYKDGLKRFGGMVNLDNWINSIRVFLIVCVEAINNFIGFENKKEISSTISNFLKWAIIK
jgi:formyltetrahydrofolate synthetase